MWAEEGKPENETIHVHNLGGKCTREWKNAQHFRTITPLFLACYRQYARLLRGNCAEFRKILLQYAKMHEVPSTTTGYRVIPCDVMVTACVTRYLRAFSPGNTCVKFMLVTVLDLCTVCLSVHLHTNLEPNIMILKKIGSYNINMSQFTK